MVNFWIFRENSFGSPFRNVNSGRNTEGDSENNKRFEAAASKYLSQFSSKYPKLVSNIAKLTSSFILTLIYRGAQSC